jgi:hypothetical protein
MHRQFRIDLVTGARVIADSAEQVAQDLCRTVAAVEKIVDGVKVFYEVVSPLVKGLKAR